MVVTLPRTVGTGLAARMADLDARYRAAGLDGSGNGRQCLSLGVIPESGTSGSNTSFRGDSRRLDGDQTGAAAGQPGVMGQMPVVNHAVGCGILAHGRYGDAIAEGDGFQLERGEQFRHVESLSNRMDWGSVAAPVGSCPDNDRALASCGPRRFVTGVQGTATFVRRAVCTLAPCPRQMLWKQCEALSLIPGAAGNGSSMTPADY